MARGLSDMQLQHTMYAPRVGVQVIVNTATVAQTCLNPGLGRARRARRSQEEQGGARRSDGGARGSQEEPEKARRSQDQERRGGASGSLAHAYVFFS